MWRSRHAIPRVTHCVTLHTSLPFPRLSLLFPSLFRRSFRAISTGIKREPSPRNVRFSARCWKLSPSFVSQLVNVTRTPLHLRNVIEIPLCAFNCTRDVKFESNGREGRGEGGGLVDGVSRCARKKRREEKQRSNGRQKNSGNNVFVAA